MRKTGMFSISQVMLVVMLAVSITSCGNAKTAWLSTTAGRALDKGQVDTAIEKYQALIDMNPKEYSYYWNLGIAYMEKGDYRSAQKQVVKLSELNQEEYANQLEEAIRKRKKK